MLVINEGVCSIKNNITILQVIQDLEDSIDEHDEVEGGSVSNVCALYLLHVL